jgi:WD40 repeat protein
MLSHVPSSWGDPVRKIFRGHRPSSPRTAQLGVSRPNEVKPASPEIDGPKVLNHNGEVFSASFSPDGKILASASLDRRFRLWDVQKAVIIRQVELRTGQRTSISSSRVAAIAFSGNEVMFAMVIHPSVGPYAYVGIFDTITGEGKAMLHPPSHTIHLAYTPDCLRLVSVHVDHSVWLYDLASDTLLQKIDVNMRCIPIIHFHESTIKVAQEPCKKFKARYWTLADKLNISAIVTEGGTIRVWDHMSGEDIARLTDYSGEIRCLTFSPDARLLFSASVDGAIRFWHIDTGSCRIFRSHILPATWVGFSPDGQMLASASTDGTVKLWDLEFLIQNSVIEPATIRDR